MKRGAIRVVTTTGITNTCMTSANQFYFDHIITFLNRRTGAAQACCPGLLVCCGCERRKMGDIRKYVGKRIRYLRKQKHMTSQMLAERIGKSRSVISKYESGDITIDIVTLEKIARVLGCDLNRLIEYPVEEKFTGGHLNSLFGEQRELFLYYYDGRRKEVMKSYLLVEQGDDESEAEIQYYLGVPEFDRVEESDFVYKGRMDSYDLVTYFSVVNQMNPVDRLSVCVLNPLHQNQTTWGILFALLSKPIAPYAVKILVAKQMLSDKEITKEKLEISKDELRRIQRYNMIYADNN